MSETISLPKWGMTMTEATVVNWLKQVGDKIQEGENLVEVQTEKVSTLIEAPISGTVTAILVPAGQTIPVGTDLAVITP